MAYEKKDNTGALFPNDKKEKDTHPDVKGDALVDGVEYWLSGWLKETKNGVSYTSLSLKKKDAKTQHRDVPIDVTDDQDVPF
jgi:hypothetical protein